MEKSLVVFQIIVTPPQAGEDMGGEMSDFRDIVNKFRDNAMSYEWLIQELNILFTEGKKEGKDYVGFCTECRFKIKSFNDLIKCPNCGTTGIPCAIENDVTIKINWHELSILCIWAERWGMQIKEPGVIYGIAHAIEAQYPNKNSLTLAGQVNEVKKEYPDTKLYDGEGKEIQT